ncbi:ATP-binding protein [Derxia gummosa]|uniref:ATP-binding protein n=1 Tax=Derxia gummosa DSM 723 TaxID=1121388 RepID=A0A8B6XC28_9BURK|nr:ATP-binding protein [Derxia gummosa]
MDELSAFGAVEATYQAHHLPQYRGNPMVEALPATLRADELLEFLSVRPGFEPEQREWATDDRLHMLATLRSFVVPLQRHVELAQTLDSMLRSGYVGRMPRTPEYMRRCQSIYDQARAGASFANSSLQLSALLMGMPGMGKTTVVKRWFSQFPEVIYHRSTNTYQITRLHIEMPSDGSSIKGLGHAILHAVDRLIPGAQYYETYAKGGRTGADALMRGVARVLNMHFVGFLVADEIQNLANAHKGKQTVMTELVSACNELGVPILFIGTNKAAKVFSQDFRQSRRSCGQGIRHWDRLSNEASADGINEWRSFLETLWSFQWTRQPVALDAHFDALMHHYSQGVIDIAIKLFASAQARAMRDGSERLSPELIHEVFATEFELMHPMLDALRRNDSEVLALYDDVAPISTAALAESVGRRMQGLSTAQVPTPHSQVGAAAPAARHQSNKKRPEQRPASAAAHDTTETAAPLEDRPEDYRRAIQSATDTSAQVYQRMRELGMARPLEALVDLS